MYVCMHARQHSGLVLKQHHTLCSESPPFKVIPIILQNVQIFILFFSQSYVHENKSTIPFVPAIF